MWKRLKDESWQWKIHVVDEDMLHDLEQDLLQRENDEYPIFVAEPCNRTGIDLPGITMIDRRWRCVEIDGLKFEVPCQDWESILAMVRLADRRQFSNGREYYKINGRFHCVVLTPEQRKALIAGMEEQREEAVREGEEDDAVFAELIAQINKDVLRVVSWRAEATKKKGTN
jgi:hypothetical protein